MTTKPEFDFPNVNINQHQAPLSGLFLTNFSPEIISELNFVKSKVFENIYFCTDQKNTILTFPDKIYSPTLIIPNHLTGPKVLTSEININLYL